MVSIVENCGHSCLRESTAVRARLVRGGWTDVYRGARGRGRGSCSPRCGRKNRTYTVCSVSALYALYGNRLIGCMLLCVVDTPMTTAAPVGVLMLYTEGTGRVLPYSCTAVNTVFPRTASRTGVHSNVTYTCRYAY